MYDPTSNIIGWADCPIARCPVLSDGQSHITMHYATIGGFFPYVRLVLLDAAPYIHKIYIEPQLRV